MRTRLSAAVATATIAATIAATGGSTGARAASAADDQARADAAVAAFSDRMTELGYASEGPPDLIEDPEDAAEDEFGGCFGDFETTLVSLATPAEGETARAYSDEFSLIAKPEGADPSVPETTDFLDFAEESEFASALVVTFDEANGGRAEQFVTLMGANETVECFREEIEQSMVGEEGTEDSAASAELSIEVSSESELSVGEHSASLSFAVDSNLMGESFAYAVDLHAAQVDRSIAVVLHGTFGDIEPADFDYASALSVVVDALAG